VWDDGEGTAWADSWTEVVRLTGAKPVIRYVGAPVTTTPADPGAVPGGPAVTRHELGSGQAWYVSARTDTETTARLLASVCEAAGVDARSGHPELEIIRRAGGGNRFTVLINHGSGDAEAVVNGQPVAVPAGEARVIR